MIYITKRKRDTMNHKLHDAVLQTRTILRKQQLATILEQFDHNLMNLTAGQRIEKYNKMAESAFRFYRGSAFLFYYDTTSLPSPFHTPTDCPTWIMGDMHIDNFGAFRNERGQIVYDVNDFDEGYVGSYLYDVLRMSVSIALYLEEQGYEETLQKTAIQSFLNAYVEQLKRFKSKKDDPKTLMFTKENTKGPIKRMLKKLEKRQQEQFMQDITTINENGEHVFKWNDEIHPIDEHLYQKIEQLFPNYNVKDIAVKHGSGTASIGLERYYILADNTDASGQEDLVLEMKEVRTAIPAYFFPYNEEFWKKYEHQGARVIETQKAMHHLQDPHLTFVTLDDVQYYIRERSPFKKKVKPKHYRSEEEFSVTTEIMGKIAAKIHARADSDTSDLFDYQSEEVILKEIGKNVDIFIYKTTLQALHYLDIVKKDYELFKEYVNEFKSAVEVSS